tara:strand:- start:637 stop:1461 length:825 start_codon:yes stop_codon:yes gene_type:complete
MSKNIEFGIIQGRLTQSPPNCLQWFPNDSWEDEFRSASKLDIDFIELIAEISHNPENPIWSDTGIKKISELCEKNELSVYSLCNDYIINNSFNEIATFQQNIKLIEQCKKLKIKKYILPFFNKSEMNVKNQDTFVKNLLKIADFADNYKIQILLETIMNGEELMNLLKRLNHENIKIVFDTGNRVAFGHNLPEDIKLLGNNIEHVHIKDKDIKHNNVILGTGLVNFNHIFKSFRKIKYNGAYVFETTRGNNPLNTAAYNINFSRFFIENSKMET